jgi:hypothetical protein
MVRGILLLGDCGSFDLQISAWIRNGIGRTLCVPLYLLPQLGPREELSFESAPVRQSNLHAVRSLLHNDANLRLVV